MFAELCRKYPAPAHSEPGYAKPELTIIGALATVRREPRSGFCNPRPFSVLAKFTIASPQYATGQPLLRCLEFKRAKVQLGNQKKQKRQLYTSRKPNVDRTNLMKNLWNQLELGVEASRYKPLNRLLYTCAYYRSTLHLNTEN